MREIKFRAWDKEVEVMYNWGEICLNAIFKALNSDELELMQYTGLKDKNGVEIYEGDIVLVLSVLDKDNKLVEFKGRVKYEDYGFVIEEEEDGYWPLGTLDGHRNFLGLVMEIEVIGNIYENANLLEGNNENKGIS